MGILQKYYATRLLISPADYPEMRNQADLASRPEQAQRSSGKSLQSTVARSRDCK
jgi:hypothetical protein